MTPAERQHAYEVEVVIDGLLDDADPFVMHAYEEYIEEAERIVTEHQTGHPTPYTYLVRLDTDGRYRAYLPGSTIFGCTHTGSSASVKWAKIEAVRQHEQSCVGRRGDDDAEL